MTRLAAGNFDSDELPLPKLSVQDHDRVSWIELPEDWVFHT
ncbi:hypothetical protein [Parasphingorhabdus halotolerans]|nr:hypothetical protein [Parasphingorhabdus halotolerans]